MRFGLFGMYLEREHPPMHPGAGGGLRTNVELAEPGAAFQGDSVGAAAQGRCCV
jgi:hypothetical protein